MNHDELIARLNYDAPCNGDKDRYEAARALRDLVRERDELQDMLTKALGLHLDCIKERDEARALYNELIYAVASKFPGESRHETALRYIQYHEMFQASSGCDTARGEPT